MAMAKRTFKPIILFTQWRRRCKSKNFALKTAQKEAKQFAKDFNKRRRKAIFVEMKSKFKFPLFAFLLIATACFATYTMASRGVA